jgi:hypothetical protein
VGAAAEGLHRRPAGVAGGGAEDGLGAVLGGQNVVIEPRQQLHGHVLEGQARAVEELGEEEAGGELLQRHGGRVGEGGVGLGADVVDGFAGQFVAGEAREDLGGDLGVGAAGEGGDLIG